MSAKTHIFWISVLLLIADASAFSCDTSGVGAGGSVVLCFVPLILFLAVLFWALQKKTRKKVVSRTGPVLIFIELMLCGVVPLIIDSDSCFGPYWLLFPAVMGVLLAVYVFHRKQKEKRYIDTIIKQKANGHIDPSVELDVHVKKQQEAKKTAEITKEGDQESYLARFKPPPGLLARKKTREEPKPKMEEPLVEEVHDNVEKAENVHFELEDEPPVHVEPRVKIEEEKPDHKEMEKIISGVLEKSKTPKAKDKKSEQD
ncbi:MAG: hypothetical protein JXB14_06270 [Candidatus Altiarchaeota archaeon]|nr:hypothetical protein [Candidatus Altiarchaeota archaeon]